MAYRYLGSGQAHAVGLVHAGGSGPTLSTGLRRPLVIVLGMHRSGTSLCANVLAALGVDMAEAAGPSPHNARGHWERHRINDLHDDLFGMYRGRWDDAGHHLALPNGWWTTPAAAAIGGRIADYLSPILDKAELAGFKDPRTARLLPLWDAILERLNAEPRFVFCLRDPGQVARSVQSRDGTERSLAEYRWLVYNAHALQGIGARPICIVPYEDWFLAPAATARRLAQWIRPDRFFDDATLKDLVSTIIDANLRHDAPDAGSGVGPAASHMSALIRECSSSNTLSPILLSLSRHFLEFEQAITPLLREAITLRASVADQNRVIHDLQAAIRQVRQGQ